MDLSHFGFVAKAALCREIEFVRYRKPHVVEYPTNAVVLNPRHASTLRHATDATSDAQDEHKLEPSANHRNRRPRQADEDDPRYQTDDELLCNDATFYSKVLQLRWRQAAGPGAGLENFGNTCYLNSVLQAIAHTPPLAQYLMYNFKQPHQAAGAPIDFAYHLADAVRQIRRVSVDGVLQQSTHQRYTKPVGIVKNLTSISKTLRPGQQHDAHEFLVYLIQAVQHSLLFRMHGNNKKLPLRISTTTPILRLCGGYLRSQVSWSLDEELDALRRTKQLQQAADLELMFKNRLQNVSSGSSSKRQLHSNTYDPTTVISLTITTPACHSLNDCLAEYCRVEKLDGKIYTTPRKVQVHATKCMRLHIPPPVLVLQLKRFDAARAKVKKRVTYPNVLDVAPYCTEGLAEYGGPEASTVYELDAVIIHEGGSLSYGHYYAFVRLPNKVWACCNDQSVSIVSEEVALRQEGYLLFYTKKSVEPTQPGKRSTSATPTSSPRLSAAQPRKVQHDALLDESTELTEKQLQEALANRRAATLKQCSAPTAFTQSSTESASVSLPVDLTACPRGGVPARRERRRYVDESDSDDNVHKDKDKRLFAAAQRPIAADTQQSPTALVDSLHRPRATAAGGRVLLGAPSEPAVANPSDDSTDADNAVTAAPLAVGVDALKVLHRTKQQESHATVERPRHAPRLRTAVRDEQWEKMMDAGRVKKVRRRDDAADDTTPRANRFQNAGVAFDIRGRRIRDNPQPDV